MFGIVENMMIANFPLNSLPFYLTVTTSRQSKEIAEQIPVQRREEFGRSVNDPQFVLQLDAVIKQSGQVRLFAVEL